jgi:glucose-1-phosphate thymidylyltransferase
VHHGDVLLRERLSALSDDFTNRDLDALILRPGLEPAAGAGSAGYIISPEAFPAISRQPAALDDVLHRMRSDGARVSVREVDACMPCRGGAEQLLEANRRMLEQLVPANCGERVFDSQISGPVVLHPSAEVRESIIRGPVTIGPRARIVNAYVGPYTSIGAGVDIDCVELEHSIVLDDAQIRAVSSRIESSVVGPGARVTRDFDLPRATRLFVGEGARVSFPL